MEATVAATVQDLPVGSHDRIAAAISVRELAHDDAAAAARWDAFVLGCPQATFFHRAGWQRIIREVFRHRTWFLQAERSGAIEGVLPLAQVKSALFGNALVSLPFGVYGGVAATNEEAAAALEQRALELAVELGVDHLEFRNVAPRHSDWPAQDLYVTFRKEILPEVEANMLAIPRKQRAMVRKGIKNELRSVVDADAGPLLRAVFRQRPPPRHAAVFTALLRDAAARVRARLRGADRRGQGREAAVQRAELLLPGRSVAVLRRR